MKFRINDLLEKKSLTLVNRKKLCVPNNLAINILFSMIKTYLCREILGNIYEDF